MPKLRAPIVDGVKFLSLSEAADLLGYSTRWVYDLIYSGKLRATKRGNCWFINPREITRLNKPLAETFVEDDQRKLADDI